MPQSRLSPSVICLGTASFGTDIPEDEAFRMMDSYTTAGGNFLDTAYIYASWIPGGEGASERTIGKWAESRGCRRDIIIGTKGCTLDTATMQYPSFRSEQISAEFHESLDRLRTDYVDIYWLHRDNPAMPVYEILDAFQDYLSTGQMLALGASNWSPNRLKEAAECASVQAIVGFSASEIGWSLAKTNGTLIGDPTTLFMDAVTYAYHLGSEMPVVAFSSQARGFFAGLAEQYLSQCADSRTPGSLAPYISDENFSKLSAATGLAQQRGIMANDVALAYVFSHPFPSAAIVGPSNITELTASMRAADIRLSTEEVAYLNCQM